MPSEPVEPIRLHATVGEVTVHRTGVVDIKLECPTSTEALRLLAQVDKPFLVMLVAADAGS